MRLLTNKRGHHSEMLQMRKQCVKCCSYSPFRERSRHIPNYKATSTGMLMTTATYVNTKDATTTSCGPCGAAITAICAVYLCVEHMRRSALLQLGCEYVTVCAALLSRSRSRLYCFASLSAYMHALPSHSLLQTAFGRLCSATCTGSGNTGRPYQRCMA